MRTIGAAALASGGFAGAATASGPTGKPLDPGDRTEPNPDVQVRKVDREVQGLTAHYPLLTLPEDTVVSFIEDSDYGAEVERKARRKLAELRQKFPITKERDGNTTWLRLAKPDATPTSDDRDSFSLVHDVFADGASGRGGDVSALSKTSIHRKSVRDACNEMWLSDDNTQEIAPYADDPDNPSVELGLPTDIPHFDDVEAAIENGLEELMHHYGQYCDTDAFQFYSDDEDHSEDFGTLGGAEYAADYHMDKARNNTGATRNEFLGKACHYPQDMGVPLHTGMGWEQANIDIYYDIWSLEIEWSIDPMYWLHSDYEEYTRYNWDDGHYLKWEYGSDCGDDCYSYYPIDSVEEAIWDMADYSGQYSYDVYHHIMDEGDVGWTNWDSDTRDFMKKVAENCYNQAGLYVRGFIHEFYG